jgi:hypothetical protein
MTTKTVPLPAAIIAACIIALAVAWIMVLHIQSSSQKSNNAEAANKEISAPSEKSQSSESHIKPDLTDQQSQQNNSLHDDQAPKPVVYAYQTAKCWDGTSIPHPASVSTSELNLACSNHRGIHSMQSWEEITYSNGRKETKLIRDSGQINDPITRVGLSDVIHHYETTCNDGAKKDFVNGAYDDGVSFCANHGGYANSRYYSETIHNARYNCLDSRYPEKGWYSC